MRVNVYTEEIPDDTMLNAEIVEAKYISSRTGKEMTNFGLRIYLLSHPALHFVPPRDDDRSAVTFWLGPDRNRINYFLKSLLNMAYGKVKVWGDEHPCSEVARATD